jgi:flagellar protein FliS
VNAYAKSADAYLTQRVLAASPEQQAALIMEAGQRHLGKASQAFLRQDVSAAAASLSKVLEAITEATLRLNYEDGGELVENLEKLYDWWTRELVAAGHLKDVGRLTAVGEQMGEIRQAWEQLHDKKIGGVQGAAPAFGNQVV